MAVTLLRHAGQKPPPGVPKLDFSQLAVNLTSAWVMNEVGSLVLNDATGQNRLTAIGTTSWISTLHGPAIATGGGSTSGWQNLATARGLQAAGSLSIAMRAYFVLDNSATHTFVSVATTGGGNGVNIAVRAGPKLGAYRSSSGGALIDSTQSTGFHDLVYTTNATTDTLWVDGVSTTTTPARDTGALTSISLGVNSNPSFPENILSTERLVYVYIWDRVLSATDVRSLMAEPYAMFQMRPIQRWPFPFIFLGTAAVILNTPTISANDHQFARLTADVSAGGWTTELAATTNLYASVDEVAPNDTDYIQSSSAPASDPVTLAFGTLLTPQAGTKTLHYRYEKAPTGMPVDLTVELLEAGVVVQTWTHTDISSTFTDASQTVTGVSDYTAALSIRFTANQP